MTEVRCAMNARGGFIESDAPYLVESPGTGAGVMLTLDSSIQRACEAVGIEMVDKGCIVVLDAPTGRVRASVSLPLYDPENVAASIARQDTSLVNRALSAYNVGSVFKPLLAAAALEQGISAQETYECTGSIEVGGHVYRCAYGRGHGTVDMKTALEQSCNCYFVQLGLRLGAQTVYDITKSAGFGQSQQVAGGLRAASEYTQSVTESLYRPVQRQVMDKDVAEVIRQMLVGVVEEGLGRKAAPRAGGAGGKTGTAQTGRYQEDGEEIMDAWFVGFYPAEEPRYTIAVLLDSGTHDSDDAAQVFAKVTDALSFFLAQE